MKCEGRPLISVLMPVYNADHYVSKAINSILEQSYDNFELLIVDDASDDSSLDIIQRYKDSRIKWYKNSCNLGYLKSVNFLLSEAKGDFITFQDADDWSHSLRFQKQLEAFENDTDLMFCGTQCVHSKNGKEINYSNYPVLQKDVVAQLERGDTVVLCGASVMLKRKLIVEYQGYREFFDRIGAEDLDWFWRMLIDNKYKNLKEYLYTYRYSPSSITRRLDLNPLRYHSTQIALLAYWQNKLQGRDFLYNEESRSRLVEKVEAQYRNDDSLIFRRAALTQLAFGQWRSYFWCLKESVSRKGITFANLKLMLIWLPMFIFLYLSPKRLQRKIVEHNNLNYLKTMGIDVVSNSGRDRV